ncbi:MAG: undecaprenyl/decaprenyl-phosphate alpha-N-acetylglucosaminyl 1-phosphate transferase [Armatimonadetes bacterium]|nr:undecaprenyl/decaprenyl-phosphate alpha-N-acetylglucosaminyl 1-phosphate transferase [Candidatus Hippobium faecium]
MVIGASLISFLIALLISASLTPFVIKLSQKLGIVVKPGGRRIHDHDMPLMGGIGIYFGILITNLLIMGYFYFIRKEMINVLFMRQILGVLIGATFISIVGVLDDKLELNGKIQLMAMLISGLILAIFNVRVTLLSNPLPNSGSLIVTPIFWGIIITVIWTTMVTKAVDCIDGMDGLCAGFAVITSITFAIMAITKTTLHQANPFLVPLTASLAGGCLGFLFYNFSPAKIFMGTIGSQLIGFTLASISIMGSYKITVLGILAPLLILGIPVFDTTYVVLKRVSEGRSIDDADKSHIHHRLQKNGKSVRNVVLTIYLLTVILCLIALYIFFTGK